MTICRTIQLLSCFTFNDEGKLEIERRPVSTYTVNLERF